MTLSVAQQFAVSRHPTIHGWVICNRGLAHPNMREARLQPATRRSFYRAEDGERPDHTF